MDFKMDACISSKNQELSTFLAMEENQS